MRAARRLSSWPRVWTVASLLCAACSAVAAAQAPDTDVFLAPLTRIGDSIVVGPALNVTHRVGYDNQPAFLPDSRGFLYTVVADGQADIWRYDIAEQRSARVTNTPESEYSATVMPGGKRFSTIRVERDSTQRLWSFALDGSDPQLVLRALKPVGYHAWLDSTRLVTYVLGSPSSLHVVLQDESTDTVRARDVGRAVHRVPGRPAFTYTQRDSAKVLWIMRQAVYGGTATALVRAATDNEFHSWTADAVLLSATDGRLVRWNGVTGAGGAWTPIATLATAGLKNVSRLAVSPDGKWLAFVAEPATR